MGDEGNEEDLALMAKIARGDEGAFAKIVKKTLSGIACLWPTVSISHELAVWLGTLGPWTLSPRVGGDSGGGL